MRFRDILRRSTDESCTILGKVRVVHHTPATFQNSRAHFDNDLAEGSAGQMLVGFTRLLEGIDLIDYWMNLVSVEEIVHAFEGAGRRDGYAANCSLPKDNAHEVEVRFLTLQKANLRDVAPDSGMVSDFVETVPSLRSRQCSASSPS